MIDTHCHLDTPAFDADRDEVVARANGAGVVGMLVPAIRPRTWPALVEWARQHVANGVRIGIGIHPQIVPELGPDELELAAPRDVDLDVDALAARIADAAMAAGAIAIGECGLDGGTAMHELQEAVFRAHVRAARAVGMPLVVHVLRAHDRAPVILREERAHEVGGVLHSYSGGADLVGIYRELGMAFSFAGPVTYANARRPIAAARVIPSELVLVETDAPDQAPEEERGKRSEPASVRHVLRGLATARSVALDEIIALTSANARRIFRNW